MQNYTLVIQSLAAEAGTVSALLEKVSPDDLFGKASLQSRLDQLNEKFDAVTKEVLNTHAETVLFFGGLPVTGSYGIKADFAADALKHYQDLVSTVYAAEIWGNQLSESGPIPAADKSTLSIVGTPRGSFGFALIEETQREQLTNSKLSEAVEESNFLINSAVFDDEFTLQEKISETHPRILTSLREFFSLLNTNKATMRIVSKKNDITIDAPSAEKASEKTEHITITTKSIEKTGVFLGATLKSRSFDFQTDDGIFIKGKVSKKIDEKFITTMDHEYTEKKCVATFELKETHKKNSDKPRLTWSLLDIRPTD